MKIIYVQALKSQVRRKSQPGAKGTFRCLLCGEHVVSGQGYKEPPEKVGIVHISCVENAVALGLQMTEVSHKAMPVYLAACRAAKAVA